MLSWCKVAGKYALGALVTSLWRWSGCWWWSQIVTAVSPCISVFRRLFKIRLSTFDHTQVLVLNHNVRFRAHVVRKSDPVCTKVRYVLLEIL